MKPKFCPNCRRIVPLPDMLKNANIKAEKGVKVKCGNCPNGLVKFKIENNERL